MTEFVRQVALMADIHGNLISLQAVLADIARRGVDEIVCLGDVAANGPQPRRCLDRLQSVTSLVVMGNADAWLLDPRPNPAASEFQRKAEETERWCLDQLSPAHLRYLGSFRPTLLLDTPTPLLAFHATPRSNREMILPTTPLEEMAAIFAGFPTPLLACGHSHQPFVRRIHAQTLINPGSVGLPYVVDRQGKAHNPPWAEYGILGWDNAGGVEIRLLRVPVDSGEIRQAIVESGMPYAEMWAADW